MQFINQIDHVKLCGQIQQIVAMLFVARLRFGLKNSNAMKQIDLKPFLKKNWFKILLIGLILFLFFNKDFSFSINLKSPQTEEPPIEEQIPVQQQARQKSTERFTDVGKTNKSELFQINPLAGKQKVHSIVTAFDRIDEATKVAFIRRFGHVAISERKKYGIPASLILANSLLISNAGERDFAKAGNSFFGIQCSSDWLGEEGFYEGKCVRHYENAWTSFRDHSLFLTTGKYSALPAIGAKNYTEWAQALQKANFYEGPNFDQYIIAIIKQFSLDQFDLD